MMGHMRFEIGERALANAAELAAGARRLVTATFAGCDGGGRFLVLLPDRAAPVAALSLVALAAEEAGEPLVVALDAGGLGAPVILGRLRERVAPAAAVVRADGERLVLRAEREIELRCGEASVVLTRAGKVLIRGTHVVSRSKGANKIKGAHVDIN
jgi:Domain of unknown function (DUF6484)